MMTPYKSLSGKKSGVTAFKIGSDFIVVKFSNSGVYKYTTRSAGITAIETMKQLALASEGLSTYIAQNNPPYE